MPPGEDMRPIRPRHDDPIIPEGVDVRDLHPSARNELKTLSLENAEWVALHLAAAASLIDTDPALAHQHALSASRRAGRIAIVRETLAITAYANADFALALRELRTYRRISGSDEQIALMVDSERGVGRPDRALELGRSVDRSRLDRGTRVELAIAMSGAQLDLGHLDRALLELDIPELNPDVAFAWSPGLFAARATVLEELGRDEEARVWRVRAEVAAEALGDGDDGYDDEVVEIDEIDEIDEVEVDEVEVDEHDAQAAPHADTVAGRELNPEPEDEPVTDVGASAETDVAPPAGIDAPIGTDTKIGIDAQIAAEFAEIEAEIEAAPEAEGDEAAASTAEATGAPAPEDGE